MARNATHRQRKASRLSSFERVLDSQFKLKGLAPRKPLVSVLIVDDSIDTCRILKDLLEHKGYDEVIALPSGEAALAYLRADLIHEAPPPAKVVLLDVDMPGMNGIEVCRRIKATPHLRDIAVLIVTAYADERMLQRAFEAGACDYLTKPVSPVELEARVRSAWNLRRELEIIKMREQELREATEQLQRLNRKLQRLSMVDELTEVSNRRFFNILLGQEWSRATRDGLPLSLILIDVDFFKNFNDRYGHPEGDRCLMSVAKVLNGEPKRAGDYVARYGGEEFTVLLTHTGREGAVAFAEKLRERVRSLKIEHRGSPFGVVTISLGVATMVPQRRSASETLIRAADQALYEAKNLGRNQVKAFDGRADAGT